MNISFSGLTATYFGCGLGLSGMVMRSARLQQGLQIMRRKVLNVFEATELGKSSALAARVCAVRDDFTLRGILWGDL